MFNPDPIEQKNRGQVINTLENYSRWLDEEIKLGFISRALYLAHA